MSASRFVTLRGPGPILAAALCLGLMLLCTALAPAGALAASARPTISFSPLTTHVRPGQVCTLSVLVDDAVDSLSCMEIGISFDTAYASCTAALEGKLYTQASFPRFFRWERPGADTVSAVDCVLGYRSYILPPGELVRFTFQAKKYGICRVYFQRTRLFDIDRVELDPIDGDHAEIVVSTQSGGVPSGVRPASLDSYPNPFNPSTILVLLLPADEGRAVEAPVSVEIYGASGARVRSLFNGTLPAGRYEIPWDGRDDAGRKVAAGVYVALARTGAGVTTHKMVMVR